MPFKVLIIDDDPDVVDFIRLTFDTMPDAKVSASHNEEDADFFLKGNTFDLVILDLMMPGSNGFDICKKIRLLPHQKDVKVLAITGFDTPEFRSKIMQCGASGYLAKPFTIEEFRKRLKLLFPDSKPEI